MRATGPVLSSRPPAPRAVWGFPPGTDQASDRWWGSERHLACPFQDSKVSSLSKTLIRTGGLWRPGRPRRLERGRALATRAARPTSGPTSASGIRPARTPGDRGRRRRRGELALRRREFGTPSPGAPRSGTVLSAGAPSRNGDEVAGGAGCPPTGGCGSVAGRPVGRSPAASRRPAAASAPPGPAPWYSAGRVRSSPPSGRPPGDRRSTSVPARRPRRTRRSPRARSPRQRAHP